MNNTVNKDEIRQQWRFLSGVAVAQIISFIAALGGTMMEKLGDNGTPMLFATLCYFQLAVINGCYLIKKQGFNLQLEWWKYLLFAFIDVTAAYCTLRSLQYTTVTSWALIQPSGLVVSIPLSVIFLKASYSWKHLISAVLAVIGVTMLVISDASGDDSHRSHKASSLLAGDLLALVATFLYSLSNIIVEFITKSQVPQYEILAMLGCFGGVMGSLGNLVIGESINGIVSSWDIVGYSLLAVWGSFGYYMLAPIVFKFSGTAVLQICLLGMNVWSVLGKIIILDGFDMDPWIFFFSMLAVILGVLFFTLSGDPYKQKNISYTPLETEVVAQSQNSLE